MTIEKELLVLNESILKIQKHNDGTLFVDIGESDTDCDETLLVATTLRMLANEPYFPQAMEQMVQYLAKQGGGG